VLQAHDADRSSTVKPLIETRRTRYKRRQRDARRLRRILSEKAPEYLANLRAAGA